MAPVRFALKRPVMVTMAFVTLITIGLVSSRLLPLEYFPSIEEPGIWIQIPYQGSTPEEVERTITRPVEEVVATLSGIKRMNSRSTSTNANIDVDFDWGTDIAVKAVEARERIEAIRNQLPDDVRRINVFKFNLGDLPVLRLRISSERDLSGAYDMIMKRLIRPLERVPGVARVDLEGIEPREIRIELIADRVVAHGVDLIELQRQLEQVNFSSSAGLILEGETRYRVNPRGEFTSIDQIRDLVIAPNGLRLGDIADVTFDNARRNYARHLDRKYAIGVTIYKENKANLVDVGERVLAEIDEISRTPEMRGIQLFFLDNQAEGVTSSLRELLKAGLLGMTLSLFVLFFFLRHIPTTLMVSMAVPVAITITLGVMYFLGLSLNILSMMGLMLAVGMLVDNAVVVSESIHTEREKHPGNPALAAERGVRSVGLAVAAGTLTSAAVFLPIIFGEKDDISIFLTHVAAAICVSLGVSLLIAQTLIPLIASRLAMPKKKVNGIVEKLRDRYVRLLRWNLRHHWLAAVIVVAALGSIAVPAMMVETDMFSEDQGRQLWLSYHLDGDYALEKVKESVDRIEEYLYANQERFDIRAVYTYYNEEGDATSSILLTEDGNATRSSSEISREILEGLPKIAIGRPSFDFRRSSGEKLNVTLTGSSSEVLQQLGEDVERALGNVEGFIGVDSEATAGDEELQVRVNRERANLLGFSTMEVARVVSIALRGVELREFKGEESEIPVRLQFREADREDIEDLRGLRLQNEQGESVPLMALVDVEQRKGPAEIRRVDRRTGLRVTVQLDDMTPDEAREVIEQRMEQLALPPGYDWTFGGGFSDDAEAMQKMVFNILLAICIIYIILAAQFESLIYPASMVCTIIFSVVGVYWFFLITGTTFTIMALIGILILIGVVVNNGIVLIDHINQLRLAGMDRDEALVQAGRDRLRPILMTVGTTVLGLTPLCIGTTQIGGDGPPYYPMARAIVGGLLFSTVVSLVFLPTIYVWLDAMRAWPGKAGALFRRLFGWIGGKFGRAARKAPA